MTATRARQVGGGLALVAAVLLGVGPARPAGGPRRLVPQPLVCNSWSAMPATRSSSDRAATIG